MEFHRSLSTMALLCLVLAGLTTALAEMILTIPRAPTERVTSLAVSNDVVVMTLLDLSKEAGQNGQVLTYKIGASDVTRGQFSTPMVAPIWVRIDKCQRLWILDCGIQNISGVQNKQILPKLQIIDLKTSSKIGTHVFRSPHHDPNSFLATFTVDVGDTCNKTTVYVADFNTARLVVFDWQTNSSKVLEHQFFHPDPMSDVPLDAIYNKRQRDLSGIYGLAVQEDYLVFHALASKNTFAIEKKSISVAHEGKLNHTDASMIGWRPVESGTAVYDDVTSAMLYAEMRGVGCVGGGNNDELKQFNDENALVADISLDGRNLYVLQNGKENSTIQRFNIDELLKNSHCHTENTSTRTRIDVENTIANSTASVAAFMVASQTLLMMHFPLYLLIKL